MPGSPQNRAAAVRRRVFGQLEVLQARDQGVQGDLGLYSGQWRAEAVVDSAAEAEVLVVLAGRVEVVGVVEPQRVPVSGGEYEDQWGALGDGDVRDLDVRERGALREQVDGGS